MSNAAHAPVIPNYARFDVTFERGDGVWLYAEDGKEYLDFGAGIAVITLGHCHPQVVAAAHSQLDTLWHTSNLYWTNPMAELATVLSARFGGAQAYFCNSGAESIEAGLKYARKATGKPGIVALENSFHGRTFGALSVTGQPAKHTGFKPLVPDVRFAKQNDAESLAAAAADGNVGCILIEPIQGEGGVNPTTPEFLASAAELARSEGALLFFDEVQSGTGRTGTFFAYEQLGTQPDLTALAKGLANGLPIGALLVSDTAARGFEPGDHATTFGGNPVSCAAALAVEAALTSELLAHVRMVGAHLAEGLRQIAGIRDVRGRGLMLGAELDQPALDIVGACVERGLLLTSAGTNVLRFTPPLVVEAAHVDRALTIVHEVLT